VEGGGERWKHCAKPQGPHAPVDASLVKVVPWVAPQHAHRITRIVCREADGASRGVICTTIMGQDTRRKRHLWYGVDLPPCGGDLHQRRRGRGGGGWPRGAEGGSGVWDLESRECATGRQD